MADRAERERLRVVIAGGGTGGHLYPGIAVARELLARDPDAQVTFAGTASGLEARVVPIEGFALDLIRSGGLKGKSIGDRVRGAALIAPGVLDAWQLLSLRRPHVVVGVGGYSSGPVVLIAALRGMPTMVLEQNAVPGLTNRLLSRVVRAAAVTFPSTVAFFGAKAFVTGNPVRPEFLRSDDEQEREDDDLPGARVLVFGGSQGAHAINLAMVEAAPELAAHPSLRLTHQTGARDVDMVRDAYRRTGLAAEVAAFYDDMAARVRRADLIVCRAGATTLAELTAAGRAAILVPLPTATDDHQRKTADVLARAGAAEVIDQRDLTGSVLAARILALAGDAPGRARMAEAARSFARPDAANAIVDHVLALAGVRQD